MAKQRELKEKEIEIDGKVYGESSSIRLSVKTAIWIAVSIVGLVLGILTYSYFKLKNEVTTSQELFIKTVNESITNMEKNINDIKIDQATIKGDIKLILDRQIRDNPIRSNGSNVQPSMPPISSDNNSNSNPNTAAAAIGPNAYPPLFSAIFNFSFNYYRIFKKKIHF